MPLEAVEATPGRRRRSRSLTPCGETEGGLRQSGEGRPDDSERTGGGAVAGDLPRSRKPHLLRALRRDHLESRGPGPAALDDLRPRRWLGDHRTGAPRGGSRGLGILLGLGGDDLRRIDRSLPRRSNPRGDHLLARDLPPRSSPATGEPLPGGRTGGGSITAAGAVPLRSRSRPSTSLCGISRAGRPGFRSGSCSAASIRRCPSMRAGSISIFRSKSS